ncbi:MAG: hypothetical protein QXG16_01545 [Candidatus Anstonellaceae archaeon]
MSLALGTNGVRALFDELDGKAAMDLGYGFAEFIKRITKKKNPSIAIARDMRLTSPLLYSATAAGLMRGGANVVGFGLLPSPVAEWGRQYYNLDGLIIVTASHNPPQWNALKFVDNKGVSISSKRGRTICNFLHKPYKDITYLEVGQKKEVDILNLYYKDVLDFAKKFKFKKLKVVADFGNGTSSVILPQILEALGMQTIFLNKDLDGTFPSRPSEPVEENLTALISKVKNSKAYFGIALDGDADRITFVDEFGNWIVGDKCLAILEKFMLENSKETKKYVITTYATSKVVQEVASAFEVKTIYTDVGAPYLSEKIYSLKEQCYIAGEEVGGIVIPSFSLAKDGILAAVILCAAVSLKPLSEWVSELPSFFNYKIKIPVSANKKEIIIKKFFSKIKSNYKRVVSLKNGFRIDFEDSWVLVRASGTENYIRIFAEAKSSTLAKELATSFANKIKI